MKKTLLLLAVMLFGFTASIKADDKADAQTLLEAAVTEMNKDLPEKMDEGMTIEKAYINDFLKMVVVQFKLSKEAGITATDIQGVGEMIRPSLVAGFKQDPESKVFIETLKTAGYGLGFEFVDELGNSAFLITPVTEL